MFCSYWSKTSHLSMEEAQGEEQQQAEHWQTSFFPSHLGTNTCLQEILHHFTLFFSCTNLQPFGWHLVVLWRGEIYVDIRFDDGDGFRWFALTAMGSDGIQTTCWTCCLLNRNNQQNSCRFTSLDDLDFVFSLIVINDLRHDTKKSVEKPKVVFIGFTVFAEETGHWKK